MTDNGKRNVSSIDIKRAKFEETTKTAMAETEKRLREAREKTERLRQQRLARKHENDD